MGELSFRKGFLKAAAMIALGMTLMPLTQPWLKETFKLVFSQTTPPWRQAYVEFSDRIDPRDVVIASEGAPLTYYGMKNLKYKINNFDENLEMPGAGNRPVKDDFAGIPILTSLSALESAVRTDFKNNVWFFFSDNIFLNPKAIPEDIKSFLMENGEWFSGTGRPVFLSGYAIPKNSILVCRIAGDKL